MIQKCQSKLCACKPI